MTTYHFPLLFILFSFTASAQFPAFTVSVNDSTVQGYYFLRLGDTPAILDGNGEVVYYFKTLPKGAINGYFGLLTGGKMVYSGINNQYVITDSTFKTINIVSCKNFRTDAHEFLLLPNGHFLLIGEDTVRMDMSRYCFFRGRCGSKNAMVSWAVIQEQDAQKNVVWQWNAKDYFTIADADTFYLDSPNYMDVNHSNSLEIDGDGNILLSSRNMNEITKINHKTGKVMWRMGGNRNQFKFINCPVPFYAQHDVRRIANGHITVFDNGENKISHGARGLEFVINEKHKTATLVWSYGLDSIYSGGWGNVQRLQHSNTLISFGKIGVSKTCFSVVNENNKIKFQLDGNNSYRVLCYPTLPWQVHRPLVTCIDSGGIKFLDAGPGYVSYKWNSGDSTRIIKVTQPGNYSVFVPYGDSGFISSEKVTIIDVAQPCILQPSSGREKKPGKEKK